MKRGCMIGVIGLLALCLVGCGLGFFVGIPRIRNDAQDGVRDALSTEIAIQIPANGGVAAPGSYTISATDLQNSLLTNVNDSAVSDIVVRITPSGMAFGVKSDGGQETTYTGVPVATDGKLAMTQMETNSGVLDFFFPADDLGEAVEQAVNNYLGANNLELESLTLGDGEITLHTVAVN
jgi:hypothetical protein